MAFPFQFPVTATDAYKFSMAEAGAALRPESFYYSHRKGGLNGWHYMPVNAGEYLKACLPKPEKADYDFLGRHNYEVGAAFQKAFATPDTLHTISVPKGSWFYNREPAFMSKGPSAIVSWLEPHAIALQFRIQVATAVKSGEFDERFKYATCDEERLIIEETCEQLGAKLPWKIQIRTDEYYQHVLKRAQKLVDLVHNPDRVFEVGMRSVSCPAQHRIALQAILEAGIKRTSNAHLAQVLGMIPVGTMGHEHIQRIGDDYEAYCWMRDRFPGFLFYLPDTFSTLYSGIPSALRVIAEDHGRDAGVRFDSEHAIRGHYTFTVARAMEMGIQPRLALESGWNYDLTVEFEKLREQVRWPEDRQAYGYGGYLVKPDWPSFLRDDVSAVWKLCKTGGRAVQKFGDEPGSAKESIPGRPLIYRPNPLYAGADVPASFILQEGEDWRPPYDASLVSGREEDGRLPPSKLGCLPVAMSPATQALIQACRKNRDEVLARAALRGL
jgi:nicotinic acid phosphoribosyltransferase